VHFEERDFFEDRFSKQGLIDLLGKESPSKLFSWRSPSFKKLGLKQDSISEDKLISLMIEEPRLIRRPIIIIGKNLVDGRDKTILSTLLTLKHT
jgi:arsenate reductase-like glutaredoxin family protein